MALLLCDWWTSGPCADSNLHMLMFIHTHEKLCRSSLSDSDM